MSFSSSSSSGFYSVRALCIIAAGLYLLNGCVSKEERGVVTESETVMPDGPGAVGEWQVDADPKTLSQMLRHGKGLLLPVLKITDQNQLVPDYRTSLALYESLKNRVRLDLVGADNTLKFYYHLVSAVEHSCPEWAVDPLLSCSLTAWMPRWLMGWLDEAEWHDESMLQAWFDDQDDVAYLIVPDRAMLTSKALRQLKYSPDSEPLVSMAPEARWQDLSGILSQVSLSLVVRHQKNCENDGCWSGLASCIIPLPSGQTRDNLVRMREQAWSDMLSGCAKSVPLVTEQ